MEKVDYIIVGGGFASFFFAHYLILNKKKFVVYTDDELNASRISAGIVNPVVLKKFSSFDKALKQIFHLRKVLSEMSAYLNCDFWIDQPVHRIFHDENERELWRKKVNDEKLKQFLSENLVQIGQITNPYGCGTVNYSGRVDVLNIFEKMQIFLRDRGILRCEKFDYRLFEHKKMMYKDLICNKIVFAEGMGVVDNPFFGKIPVVPNKGHQLDLKISNLKLNQTVKKRHFLFNKKYDSYYYGGTYDRTDVSDNLNSKSVEELEKGLIQIIGDKNFAIQKVSFAFRPTVKDRRPILGEHPIFKNIFVFNGLGTRGLLNASYYAEQLFNFTENSIPVDSEVGLSRFG